MGIVSSGGSLLVGASLRGASLGGALIGGILPGGASSLGGGEGSNRNSYTLLL